MSVAEQIVELNVTLDDVENALKKRKKHRLGRNKGSGDKRTVLKASFTAKPNSISS